VAVSVAHPQAAQPTRATSQFEAIVGSEEDRLKAAASKIENSAHRANEEQDRQAREVGEEISQLVISSRSVGDQIATGSIASGEALEQLAGFREQHRRIVARTQSIKTVYKRQLQIAKDPGAAVDDLRRRFPALNL
jgi:methylthioribose-1-phosphate isomerase